VVEQAWLIPALPLAGCAVALFGARRLPRAAVGWLCTLTVFGAFLVALTLPGAVRGAAEARIVPIAPWVTSGDFSVAWALRIDALSVYMALIVTGVGALIHLYSIGYMAHDARLSRYFAFLNLFTASMLILVLAPNFLMLYLGWELVGLCSYLLIGHWHERPAAAAAAKKAFLVNRVGDFSFGIGVLLIFLNFHTLDFARVFDAAPAAAPTTLLLISLLLFGGAVGKSAQLPLHVWLPDAMEGPTPVSALIHAATMVTAGVYLVVRCHALFPPEALAVVMTVGLATALFAGVIALVHHDLKRVLAYSTISQLGLMFAAAGVGAYGAAMFHLGTHAFFKALLFLAAGSVMHALHDELDIRKMGGLRAKLPVTAAVFGIGALALAGIPGLAGFFSKEQILWYAKEAPLGSGWAWGLVLAASAITALYSFRLYAKVFLGQPRDAHLFDGAHESPAVMLVPLGVLAAGAVLVGYLGLPEHSAVGAFLAPIIGTEPAPTMPALLGAHLLTAVVTNPGVWALLVSGLLWVRAPGSASAVARAFGPLYWAAYHKFFVDEIYAAVIVRPLQALARWLSEVFDAGVIDGAVNGVAWVTGRAGAGLRLSQAGYVSAYALAMTLGVLALLAWLVWR